MTPVNPVDPIARGLGIVAQLCVTLPQQIVVFLGVPRTTREKRDNKRVNIQKLKDKEHHFGKVLGLP